MDSDFSEKLKNVLSDPAAMAKITAIAESMGMGNAQSTAQATADAPEPKLEAVSQSILPSSFADPRMTLLETLKPLIKEEKRSRIDSIARALTVMNVMKTLRK